MKNPDNTIDKLKNESKWLFENIESSEIIDIGTAYSPTVELIFKVNLDDDSIPESILDSVKNRYQSKFECNVN